MIKFFYPNERNAAQGGLKKVERFRFLCAFFFLLISSHFLQAQTAQQLISSSKADTWVATDALRRTLPNAEETGAPKEDKFVGIFYFIWQGAHGYDHHSQAQADEGVMPKLPSDTVSPYNIPEMLREKPENPQYGPMHAFHYWAEPYFGYSLPDDEWIIRKHAQLLSDAGVDVIILDVTNAHLYLPQVKKIGEVYRKMRAEGLSTPSISFLLNTAHVTTGTRLYEDFFAQNLYKDLWFYWKGKPLLLCNPEGLPEAMKDFFTLRQSWAWSDPKEWFGDGKDKWPWLDHYPQAYGWHASPDKPEEITVNVAQHPISNIGRSFHDGKQPAPENFASGEGLCFAEQWERALEVDPEFVFVTGWNEWVAMRFDDGSAKDFLGKPIEKGETYFVDLYNEEYSRDIEPMKGSFGDNYYYQMVANIRKFKGSRATPIIEAKHTIKIDGNFQEWASIAPIFYDDQGDVAHRNHPGWGRIAAYTNTSGRNDITEARVAQDDENVYFYVKTKDPLTANAGEEWMHLYISLPNANLPDWEGYQFLINRTQKGQNITTIEKCQGGWQWDTIAEIPRMSGDKELEIQVPKKLLGIKGNDFILDFKWTDHASSDGNIMHWLDQGDAAPNGRFRYRCVFNNSN